MRPFDHLIPESDDDRMRELARILPTGELTAPAG